MNTRLLLVALGLVGSSVVIACTSSAPDTGLNEAAVNGAEEGQEKPAKNNASSSSSSSGAATTGDAGTSSTRDAAAAPATNTNEGAFDPNGDLKQQYSDCLRACDEDDDACFDKCDASLAAAVGGEDGDDGKDGEDGADGNTSRCCTKGQAFLCPDDKSCSAAGIGSCTRRADLDKNCSK